MCRYEFESKPENGGDDNNSGVDVPKEKIFKNKRGVNMFFILSIIINKKRVKKELDKINYSTMCA
mgnify:FL=1